MKWPILRDPEDLVMIIPVIALLIPIVAIIMGGLIKIVKMILVHRERIAMIENGLDPDAQGSHSADNEPATQQPHA
jgi:hypothetical protein